ncbi:Aminodeoxychorismate lyase [Purpureocillium takamizusanense]|uniref:Aminodeoxychorismate lyase n=1 Tax=Purpureocillium takamizusanense TaxID=2060973 RepID=A0A9Q8Q9S1_9HYPO|nr:Aminodeoxychorismate lyase [Purpureocillium takamizusanense]UNI16569.1 Aminodeoxychorismate lyase [Purpureocillium takamizusanense]
MTQNLPADFFIFTSIRYEPSLRDATVNLPYYLLPFHLARLRTAAAAFDLPKVREILEDEESALSLLTTTVNNAVPDKTKPWRVNVRLTPGGHVAASATSLPPLKNNIMSLPDVEALPQFLQKEVGRRGLTYWDVVVDSLPTPASLFTGHKTSVRDMYNAARARVGLVSYDEPREILLWNENGEVTEGSITTVYLWREASGSGARRLVTPPLQCGPNAGSTRRYALSKGLCDEEAVKLEELKDGDEIWLSHASDGFFPGRLRFLNK